MEVLRAKTTVLANLNSLPVIGLTEMLKFYYSIQSVNQISVFNVKVLSCSCYR